MTAQEMLPAIGATVMVACESLNVEMSRVSRGEVRTATEASKDKTYTGYADGDPLTTNQRWAACGKDHERAALAAER